MNDNWYRWHDLRKDPNDLPKRGKVVLVCSECDYGVGWRDAHRWHSYENIFTADFIAWRYIEPFDESESFGKTEQLKGATNDD